MIQIYDSNLHFYRILSFLSICLAVDFSLSATAVLVSISVFMAGSTVLHPINSNNSLLSHSVLPVLSLPYWSFQLYISV